MNNKPLYENHVISTYIIKVSDQPDSLNHFQRQFRGKDEFDLNVIDVSGYKSASSKALWCGIKKAVRMAVQKEEDVIIICREDHEFTLSYCREVLFGQVIGAVDHGANILLGGFSTFGQAIPIANGRFWIDYFRCAQLLVIYGKFFKDILNEPFRKTDSFDGKLSEMTSHKMVIHPFISVQKDSKSGDNLSFNEENTKYRKRFQRSEDRLSRIMKFAKKYGAHEI